MNVLELQIYRNKIDEKKYSNNHIKIYNLIWKIFPVINV